MAGTVKARLNHYQILGVSPEADGDEIARAFARESSIFRPHVFGGLTEVCVAYEVLRDPVKRRAYDASIGLERKAKVPELPRGLRGAATAETMVRAAPVERHMPVAAPQPEPQPMPARPALPLGPGADSNARPEPSIGRGNPPHFPLTEVLDAEVRPIDWHRTGIVLGGFVFAACALGGLAGWWSASGIGEEAQPAKAALLPIPEAQPAATPSVQDIAPPAAAPTVPEARPDRPRPAQAAATRAERKPAAVRPAAVEPQPQPDAPDPGVSEAVVDESSTTPGAEASMPLPNRVVARTIERIGYSCGSVASTAPVEGAPGVYKVTCSSGQSYRASPVNGRYRFRRLGRR